MHTLIFTLIYQEKKVFHVKKDKLNIRTIIYQDNKNKKNTISLTSIYFAT